LKHYKKCEEHIRLSDIVTILFNISNLPDEVSKKIDFSAPNFPEILLGNMNSFKDDFEKKHKVAWEYSCKNLTDCYDEFVDDKLPYNKNPKATKVDKKKLR